MKRARVVEISFVPKLARMPEITLRKNAFLVEPRVGEATGKIIGYSVALDGSDGRIQCEIRIGCAIGTGGTTTVNPGTPVYAEIAYVGADYQQFVGRTITVTPTDTSVSYEPPIPVVIPGSINFLSTLTADDVIEVPLVVEYGEAPPASQVPPIHTRPGVEDGLKTATDFVNAYWLPQYETQATFKLKNVTGDISADYTIVTTPLKIPMGYNLEAT